LCFPVFFFFFNISNSNFSTGAKGEKQKVNRKWKVHGIVFKQPTWFRFVYAAVVWQQIFPFFFLERAVHVFRFAWDPTRLAVGSCSKDRLALPLHQCDLPHESRRPVFLACSAPLWLLGIFFSSSFFLPMNKKEEKKKFHALTMKTRK
jgi:hypothetical protein